MKNPDLNHLLPKYVLLREHLRQQIQSGEFSSHALLPTEFELIRTNQVSRGTVVKAINDLVAEKLVYRIQGKGTFVADKPAPAVRNKVIGLVLEVAPHLFGPLAQAVLGQIQINGYHSMFVDAWRPELESHWGVHEIKNLIDRKPDGLILDGSLMFPFQLLDPPPPRCTVTFIFRYENSRLLKANQVLTDDEQGGYLATRHLLELGHRRILFVPTQTWNLETNSTGRRIMAGVQKAVAEAGLPVADLPIFKRALVGLQSEEEARQANKAALQVLLQKPDRPTAVFAFADNIAAEVYAGAWATGLNVPRDLSVIGYFNTPWCQMLEPALTSVSVRERELARLAVALTLKGGKAKPHKYERVLVPPELIVRGSTNQV